MEHLDEFFDKADEVAEEKEEKEQVAETLDSQIHKVVEERDTRIAEKLNTLPGDAAARVKADLDTQVANKEANLDRTRQEIDENEQELTSRVKSLERRIEERRDAHAKIEKLGADNTIDVATSLTEVSREIEKMEEQRDRLVSILNVKAKSSGKAISF